jgi:hypothetical protein
MKVSLNLQAREHKRRRWFVSSSWGQDRQVVDKLRKAGGGQTEKVPESLFVGEESFLSSNPAKDFALQGGHHSSKP